MGTELCLPRSGKYTYGEKFDPMLRSVAFPVRIPSNYCKEYERNGVTIQPGMICVGRSREEDRMASCLAAPGAPMVVNGHLAGLQSWGYGCGYENDLPLVYTSMQFYQPWLIHNIPLLRRINKNNLTKLFEAKRAYILTKWLNLTRVVSPKPFILSARHMETMKLDKELAKLMGNVYDIRDFLYDGYHHNDKTKLYQKLRKKLSDRGFWEKALQSYANLSLIPFLNRNETDLDEKVKVTPDIFDEDSDKSYDEYNI